MLLVISHDVASSCQDRGLQVRGDVVPSSMLDSVSHRPDSRHAHMKHSRTRKVRFPRSMRVPLTTQRHRLDVAPTFFEPFNTGGRGTDLSTALPTR